MRLHKLKIGFYNLCFKLDIRLENDSQVGTPIHRNLIKLHFFEIFVIFQLKRNRRNKKSFKDVAVSCSAFESSDSLFSLFYHHHRRLFSTSSTCCSSWQIGRESRLPWRTRDHQPSTFFVSAMTNKNSS